MINKVIIIGGAFLVLLGGLVIVLFAPWTVDVNAETDRNDESIEHRRGVTVYSSSYMVTAGQITVYAPLFLPPSKPDSLYYSSEMTNFTRVSRWECSLDEIKLVTEIAILAFVGFLYVVLIIVLTKRRSRKSSIKPGLAG